MPKRTVVITNYREETVNTEFIRPTFGEVAQQAEQYGLGDMLGNAQKSGIMVLLKFQNGNMVYCADI